MLKQTVSIVSTALKIQETDRVTRSWVMWEWKAGLYQCLEIREKQTETKHAKSDIGEQMCLFNLHFSLW